MAFKLRLLPRDERFFELFIDLAQHSVDGSRHLAELFSRRDPERWQLVDTIKGLEHSADDVTHELTSRLDRSFITPFDREDIHLLASRLDDIIDHIDGTASRTRIFRAESVPDGAVLIAEVIHRMTREVLRAVKALENGPPGEVLSACREIKRLEEEGDSLYHHWLAKLFDNGTDPLTVIKWKELYDILEATLDVAEDAANVLESVTLKHN
jgi:predicted phosphate transport protein (TIGR00153 family)